LNIAVDPAKLAERAAPSLPGIADGDIHPSPNAPSELYPYLAKRWQSEIETFGTRIRQGNYSDSQYPKSQPDAARRDAWPSNGRMPGTDLDFMRRQHLDANNVQLGILNTIRWHPGSLQNIGFGIAMARAINEWQVAEWTQREKRLKGSIVVPYEDAAASAAEIDHWAGHPDMVQVLLLSRTKDLLGNRRYWPIYEAAARAGLPVGVHAFGNGGHPTTSSGWPSFYIEDMVGHAQSCQTLVSSLVIEGVFEQFPTLRIVMIEAGFAWLAPLAWRLDRVWSRLKAETPELQRLPSEYISEHFWLTTQPMEEPDMREHLQDTIDWIGWDRLLFATDYPHWDFDDPAYALPLRMSPEQRTNFFIGNARHLYRQPA
jgi:predicted TIM-barrel fold metal-dependent hydrolase